MSEKLFDSLLNENDRENANKSLYNNYAVKNKLNDEVNNAIVGLNELGEAIEQSLHIAKYYNGSAKDIKQSYDKLAVLLENFISEFKDAYQQVTAIETANELIKDDAVSKIATQIGSHFIKNIDLDTTIAASTDTWISSHNHNTLYSNPAVTVTPKKEKGWNKKEK